MQNADQSEMIYLMCLSPDGEYKWRKSYASREDHPTFDIRFGQRFLQFDDLFIISGYVYSPHPSNPNIVSIRPMFIGIDTLFNEQWVLEFGLEDNMKGKAHSTIAINDSLFMGTGRYRYYGNNGETKDGWAMYYDCTPPSFQCGDPLIDDRDGQSYATVQIGDQCWMAENLNVGLMLLTGEEITDNETIEKYCYGNDPANCDK